MDEAIVRRAQQGDHDAFRVIVNASIDRLHAVAGLITREPTMAQDAVQEALVRAWRDLPKLREPASVSSWLAQLTVHATYDVLRKQRRVRQLRSLAEDSAVTTSRHAASTGFSSPGPTTACRPSSAPSSSSTTTWDCHSTRLPPRSTFRQARLGRACTPRSPQCAARSGPVGVRLLHQRSRRLPNERRPAKPRAP